jgi:hypothetical protein
MRYNSALLIGAFIATSASFVAANDPANGPDVYPTGFAGERRGDAPAVMPSGFAGERRGDAPDVMPNKFAGERRQEVPAPDPAAATGGEGGEPAPASATPTTSVASGP